MKLEKVASALKAELTGDGSIEITGVAGIEEASAGDISFVANPKYAAAAKKTRASAVIVSEIFPPLHVPTLRSKNPYFAFAKAVELFHSAPHYPPATHPTALIDSSAQIGPGAHIAAYVVVGRNVEVGKACTLLPHVVIYEGAKIGDNFFAHAHSVVREHCLIGDNVILQNGVVIGGDGYGFAKDPGGHWYKIRQSGKTVIGNNVEIQANACIDRASIGETRIGDGTKIDNLVQVGHSSHVGNNTLLCAQVGLAGSTEVGDDVILAGQVGVSGHLKIGDKVIATGQTGIGNDVKPGKIISGSPAIDNKRWLRAIAVFSRLPELARAIRGAKLSEMADVRETPEK